MERGPKRKYLLLFAAVLLAAAVLALWPLLAAWGADCVVRVSFTGLENMFHAPYEYYALGDRGAVRVPVFLAKAILGADAEERSIYDDTGTAYWVAGLQYGRDESLSDGMTYLDTSFGPGYWLTYDSWTSNTPAPGEEDIALMLRAARAFHSGDLKKWTWKGGGATGLTDFMIIRSGDRYLLEENGRLLRPLEDGGFRSIMDCPERGHFDCWFFK